MQKIIRGVGLVISKGILIIAVLSGLGDRSPSRVFNESQESNRRKDSVFRRRGHRFTYTVGYPSIAAEKQRSHFRITHDATIPL